MASSAPGYAFRGPGLDRSELLRERPDDLRARWAAARVLVVDADGHGRFPDPSGAVGYCLGAELMPELPEAASFLGLGDEGAWFALPHEVLPDPLPGKIDLRAAATEWPARDAAALAEARALLHWQQRNKFCGGCGHALGLCKGGWCARCTQCGLEHYPRTDPAIIVAVSDGERLLLGRQASWPAGRWSVLAGFVEPGESLEQAVAREVMEEAGIPVLECQYAASQPWPFPAALMIGFQAQGLPLAPSVGDELEQARWFTVDALDSAIATGEVKLPPVLSISRWLVDEWVAGARARRAAATAT
ncbi:MAG TPA: NAD(+) diphosphatase [Arenimonas sp.]|uniref:NAD(+) diphosphatase n=1 Tax=Arenimonas sp. TaxID=1872635 RepID=UPI002D7F6CB9|nr:NAD(+) diphosphatase [Arenimonas sp.]HEU0152866.1 NAD(+) diphosphatase [Arenimonas sp.]